MELSSFLAELIGFSLIVISLALLAQGNIKKMFHACENESIIFYGGIVTFVIGLAIVLSFNSLMSISGIIIVILGWLALIKGIVCLFWPSWMSKLTKNMENNKAMPAMLFISILVGIFLVYSGFTQQQMAPQRQPYNRIYNNQGMPGSQRIYGL